jgi:hypothetical protein
MATEGYEAPIAQGIWRRVTTYGIPTTWFAVWCGAAILQVILCMSRLGALRGLILGVLVVGAEFLLVQWLTRVDMQWDELRLAQWIRRYSAYYDAS